MTTRRGFLMDCFLMTGAANLLAASARGAEQKQKPVLFATPQMLADARTRISGGQDPWKQAWQRTLERANHALNAVPAPYQGPLHILYFNTGTAQAGLARDAAMAFALSGEAKYADAARNMLLAWAGDARKNVNPGSAHPLGQGLVISRVMAIFCYAYTLIYDHLSDAERHLLESWMETLPPIILATRKIWVDNDFFGHQVYNNHLAVQTMGLAVLGFTLRNQSLIDYAIDGNANVRNYVREVSGAILLPGDPLEKSDFTYTRGAPAAQAGEMYDRYRTNSKHGLGYAMLHLRALTLIAEAAFNNGVLLHGKELYQYKDPRGKSLELAYTFYAGFFSMGDTTVQGGYYAGNDMLLTDKSLYEIACLRYPGNQKIRDVLKAPNRVVNDGETFGSTTTLTHGTPVGSSAMPEKTIVPFAYEHKSLLHTDNFADFSAWHHEGSGEIIPAPDGSMRLHCLGSKLGAEGCMAFFRPDLPDQVAIEYDLIVCSQGGLMINYLAMRGLNGEDLIADRAKLPPRTGVMRDYYSHAWGLQSYHVSFSRFDEQAKNTGTSNWRRNPGLYLCGHGPDPVQEIGRKYHIRLTKDLGHCQLFVDGRLAHAVVDRAASPLPIPNTGKFGFRLIGPDVMMDISNFRVFRIQADASLWKEAS